MKFKFFHHYFLWSYRFDIFVLILFGIFVFSILGSVFVTHENNVLLSSINALSSFKSVLKYDTQLADLSRNLRGKDQLSAEQADALNGMSFGEVVGKGFAKNYIDRTYSNEPAQLRDKLAESLASKYSLIGELNLAIIVGSTMWIVLASFVSGALGGVMIYYVAHVFYFRDREIVSKHPHFVVLFAEFIVVVLAPIIALAAIDSFSLDKIRQIADKLLPAFSSLTIEDYRSLPELTDLRSRIQGVGSLFVGDVHDDATQSPILLVTVPLVAWVAAALWAARRIGTGAFLYCSVAVVIVALGIAAVASNLGVTEFDRKDFALIDSYVRLLIRPEMIPLGVGLAIFVAIFAVGSVMRSIPGRKLVIAFGYVGIIVWVSICLAMIVRTKQPGPTGFIWMLSAIWLLVSVTQVVIGRAMYGFFHEPQP